MSAGNTKQNPKPITVGHHLAWNLNEPKEFSVGRFQVMVFNIVLLVGLQYEFCGDGDSKSFPAVENIYEEEFGVVIEKKESVGQVQKRLCTALRKLKKDTKGLGGKGKQTDSMIDSKNSKTIMELPLEATVAT